MEQKSWIERLWLGIGEVSGNLIDWFAPCSKRTAQALKSCETEKLCAEAKGAMADYILEKSRASRER